MYPILVGLTGLSGLWTSFCLCSTLPCPAYVAVAVAARNNSPNQQREEICSYQDVRTGGPASVCGGIKQSKSNQIPLSALVDSNDVAHDCLLGRIASDWAGVSLHRTVRDLLEWRWRTNSLHLWKNSPCFLGASLFRDGQMLGSTNG